MSMKLKCQTRIDYLPVLLCDCVCVVNDYDGDDDYESTHKSQWTRVYEVRSSDRKRQKGGMVADYFSPLVGSHSAEVA